MNEGIHDSELLFRLGEIRNRIVESDGWLLSRQFLQDRCWTVVPVYVGEYIPESDASRYIMAMHEINVHSCFAIYAESETVIAHSIDISEIGLEQFNSLAAGLCYLLIDEDESFAMLFTPEHYGIVAGTRDFAEMALGKNIEEARQEFLTDVNAYPDSLASVRELLLSIANEYRNMNGY